MRNRIISSVLLAGAALAASSLPAREASAAAPERYMVLTNQQFVDNPTLAAFVDWKTKKGYAVTVVSTSQISAAPTGDDVVAYMRSLSESQYPRYLLILGDADPLTGVPATTYANAASTYEAYAFHYTDAEITSLGANNLLPSVYAGRLPASDNGEATLMLSHVMAMDRNPPTSSAVDMYDKVVIAGQVQTLDGVSENSRFGETGDAVAAYFEQQPGKVSYTTDRVMVRDSGVTASLAWSTSSILWAGATGADAVIGTRLNNLLYSDANQALNDVIAAANRGASLMFQRDHGGALGWGTPAFTSPQVLGLNNPNERSLVISISCLTGVYYPPTAANPTIPDPFTGYDGVNPTFVQALLGNPSGGAYAAIGATAMVGGLPDDQLAHGLFMAFLPDYRTWHNSSTSPNWTVDFPAANTKYTGVAEGSANRLGVMLRFAKGYAAQLSNSVTFPALQAYHLFGDPEAFVVLHAPQAQRVQHPTSVNGAAASFDVCSGTAGTQIALYSRGLNVHDVALTGTNGCASFSVAEPLAGILSVTASQYGKVPAESTISVTGTRRGDVDQSGVVNIVDALKVAQYGVGNPVTGSFIPAAADVNCSGTIDIVDALQIAQFYVGTITRFPCDD